MKFDLDEKGGRNRISLYSPIYIFLNYRIGLHTTGLYKEIRRAVDVELADALRQTVPEPDRIASGFGETGNGVYGSNRRGQSRIGASQK